MLNLRDWKKEKVAVTPPPPSSSLADQNAYIRQSCAIFEIENSYGEASIF